MGGDVVSTIDGHAIRLADVEHAARTAGVTPAVALARLQDEMLLAHAAERAGIGQGPEIRAGERRAMVQAFLREELEDQAVEVSDEELATAYEESRASFVMPQRRTSMHLVARTDAHPGAADAAEEWMREAHERLSAGEAEAQMLAIQRSPPHDLRFAVEVEEIGLLARDADSVDPAYLEALFEMDEPGLFPQLVRSSYGWHAIICTHIEPSRNIERDEAIENLRGQFVAAAHARQLFARQAELHGAIGSYVDMENVHQYLDNRALWERRH